MENIFDISPLIILVVPIILGLVECFKQIGLPTRLAPVASLILGVALMFLTTMTWQAIVVQGIIAGLMASGLWSGGKAIIKG